MGRRWVLSRPDHKSRATALDFFENPQRLPHLVHISPWEATLGLFAGAAKLLTSGAPLILYGPYIEPDVTTSDSNMAFDESLRSRNPAWGLRDIGAVEAAAT
ncbi:DUF938 domain-containing protein, partial [bacterium]